MRAENLNDLAAQCMQWSVMDVIAQILDGFTLKRKVEGKLTWRIWLHKPLEVGRL